MFIWRSSGNHFIVGCTSPNSDFSGNGGTSGILSDLQANTMKA
jgi:hypothetical protein